jgi:hypothetical protein
MTSYIMALSPSVQLATKWNVKPLKEPTSGKLLPVGFQPFAVRPVVRPPHVVSGEWNMRHGVAYSGA